MNNVGIYKITNVVNGKVYVGQSRNIKSRKNSHFSSLRKGKHYNDYLQRSFNKYGEDNFTFEIIELCEIEDLNKREYHWINHFKSYDLKHGYNATIPSEDEMTFVHSEKTKELLSETKRIFDDEELISYLHEFYYHNGRLPTNRDLVGIYPTYSTYIKRFGTVTNALIEAGLSDGSHNENLTSRKPYTRELILEKFNSFISKHGRFPNHIETKSSFENDLPSVNTIVNLFGSMDELKKNVNYDFDKIRHEELKNALEGLVKLYKKDGFITSRTIDKSSLTRSTQFYSENFGTLINAYVEAGLITDESEFKKLATKPPYTKEEVLKIYSDFIDKNKRLPNKYETAKAKDSGLVSKGVILNLFGSMENLLIELEDKVIQLKETELKESLKGLVALYERDGYISETNINKSG